MSAPTDTREPSVSTRPVSLDDLETRIIDRDQFWQGSFSDYLSIVQEYPSVVYSAHQRLYQSVVAHGTKKYTYAGIPHTHHNFFDDPFGHGKDAVFGLDRPLERLVNILKAAAARYGQDRRIILLHGPVGSSKSTIARVMRKGLAAYTRTEKGKLYTFSWYVDKDHEAYEDLRYVFGIVGQQERNSVRCPLHEEPLLLLPEDVRISLIPRMNAVRVRMNDEEIEMLPRDQRMKALSGERSRRPEELIDIEGELCPFCRFVWQTLLTRYQGDWKRVLQEHVHVERLLFSEEDRIGIGSFHPKDEKNQDSTELSGDINWSKIQHFGSESDPRAFDFRRGEYFVSNRGMLYKEEMLKLDKAFLYDDLHVSQDHIVKPKGFSVAHLDLVLMGGTNNPEYEGLRDDEKMEAFRDRTTRVDVPYVVRLSHEQKIYEKTYQSVPGGKHIAPHVLETASLWSVLSRVDAPKEKFTRMQKIKLYDGRFIGTDYSDDMIRKLMEEASEKEAMQGISPRYIQDKISNAIVSDPNSTCITPFMVFNELREGLMTHSLIKSEQKRNDLKTFLTEVQAEYDEMVKEEVEQAVSSDEKGITDLFSNYITNLRAYRRSGKDAKVRNPITGIDEPYNERLMREIEEQIGVGEREKDTHRSTLLEKIGEIALSGKQFDYKADENLYKALRKKLFNDRKDQIKLSTLHTRVVDREEQEKIDIIKTRLVQLFGYCDTCATMVLHHVAAIFARGETQKK